METASLPGRRDKTLGVVVDCGSLIECMLGGQYTVTLILIRPFRREQICRCLKNLLNVEYVYTAAKPGEEAYDVNLSQVKLPDALQIRLEEAAEIHSLTQLNQAIDQVMEVDENAHRFALHLRKLSRESRLKRFRSCFSNSERTLHNDQRKAIDL
jgi:hypothetical protein